MRLSDRFWADQLNRTLLLGAFNGVVWLLACVVLLALGGGVVAGVVAATDALGWTDTAASAVAWGVVRSAAPILAGVWVACAVWGVATWEPEPPPGFTDVAAMVSIDRGWGSRGEAFFGALAGLFTTSGLVLWGSSGAAVAGFIVGWAIALQGSWPSAFLRMSPAAAAFLLPPLDGLGLRGLILAAALSPVAAAVAVRGATGVARLLHLMERPPRTRITSEKSEEAGPDEAEEYMRRHGSPRLAGMMREADELADRFRAVGGFAEAAEADAVVCAALREAVGTENPMYPCWRADEALMRHRAGDRTAAEPMYREALDIAQRHVQADNELITTIAFNLTALLAETGRLEEARLLASDPARPLESPESDNTMAMLALVSGEFTKAVPLLKEQVEAARVTGDGEGLALALNNLGGAFFELGDSQEAEPLFDEAFDICLRTYGPNHPQTLGSLNNRAATRWYDGRLDEAAVILERLKGTGMDPYANLGKIAVERGDFKLARRYFDRSLKFRRKARDVSDPLVAIAMRQAGMACWALGEVTEAEALVAGAVEHLRETLGTQHADTAQAVHSLALVRAAEGEVQGALALDESTVTTDDRTLSAQLGAGSERQRLASIAKARNLLDTRLSILLTEPCPSSRHVAAALLLVFRRKALSAEAIAAQRDAVLAGHYPEARAQLEELRSLRTRIARLQLGGVLFDGDPGHEDVGALVTQMEKLEAALALTVPEVALEGVLERAGLIDVATALATRSGLVEYVRFSAFDFATLRPGTDHYAAFVMTRDDPDGVAVVDLGPARAIDRRIGQLRTIVGGSATEFDEWAEALGAAIVRPIAKLVKDCTRLLIAPDSELSRIPFEVLRLDTGERVIDRFGVSYVSTGRDVLRFEAGRQRAGTTPVVIADPDFDLAASSAHADRRSPFADQVAVPLDRATRFERLPGTRVEGSRVADLLSVTPWQGEAATEARLKAAHSPRILHIATHGFFLEMDQNQGPNSVVEVGFESGSGSFAMIRRTVDPLLRSGLVLAGVNAFLEGRELPESMEDGILTAEDVAALDLVDTELVVLSACETGLGDIRDGEGVFGLQRAVEIAGAQSLIMSLWKVPDEATADLMTELYTQLAAGEGPADALHSAQLKIQTRLPHPFYWGAFVCRGNPHPLGNSESLTRLSGAEPNMG